MIKLIKNPSLHGIIQLIASLFWVGYFGRLMYQYHYTDVLFTFRYPNWVLILFIAMGLMGAWVGLSVLLKKTKVKNGYFTLAGLFAIGLIIDLIIWL